MAFQHLVGGLSQNSLSPNPSMNIPLRSFSSQPQKNNPNRRTDNRNHKRSNVTHSDRARAAATNSNNVWSRVEQFFLPLPTDQEIEKMQKLNSSPLHCLLNAFIEITPEEFQEAKSIEIKFQEKHEYARIHALLPQISRNGYLQYPFETRLDLELESLQLNKPCKASINDKPFQTEITELRNKITNKITPEINQFHEEIVQNVPEYRKNQQLRNEEMELVDQKINEYIIKKRKRKE